MLQVSCLIHFDIYIHLIERINLQISSDKRRHTQHVCLLLLCSFMCFVFFQETNVWTMLLYCSAYLNIYACVHHTTEKWTCLSSGNRCCWWWWWSYQWTINYHHWWLTSISQLSKVYNQINNKDKPPCLWTCLIFFFFLYRKRVNLSSIIIIIQFYLFLDNCQLNWTLDEDIRTQEKRNILLLLFPFR